MDCKSFDASLLDALYEELDADSSTAMDAHAAGCGACAAQAARFSRTRELVRNGLERAIPEGLEARILAAAEAASKEPPRPQAGVVHLVSRADRPSRTVAFLSRPYLAVAATFILVLGAAALVLSPSVKRSASSSAAPPVAAEPWPAAAPAASIAADPVPPVPAEVAAPVVAASAPAARTGAKGGALAAAQAEARFDAGRPAEAADRSEAARVAKPAVKTRATPAATTSAGPADKALGF